MDVSRSEAQRAETNVIALSVDRANQPKRGFLGEYNHKNFDRKDKEDIKVVILSSRLLWLLCLFFYIVARSSLRAMDVASVVISMPTSCAIVSDSLRNRHELPAQSPPTPCAIAISPVILPFFGLPYDLPKT
jgi:hypothetical protein